MIKIAPSLLSADFKNIEREIKRVEKCKVDLLHLDVMDGHFVPNITLGPMIVEAINRCTKLPLDVHLMIENPDSLVESFVKSGADYLTISFEACKHLHRTINLIKSLKVKVGCALNPATPFSVIKPALKKLDLLLLMTVNPGFGGQKFIHSVLPKIEEAKKFIREHKLKTKIEVDGGINPQTAKLVKKAGATILVSGAAIFKSQNYCRTVKALRE
ncbi:MAG: ribulose phosphate epimerase [candidate division Zixibacteria bacterium SM23_73_3]|nr:MAG: ribulose phosphate epimerase [candidate division Zixibacteria bacterium SM23_73_3]